MITVFVYARVRLYREGLAEILAHERAFDVLGTAAELGEAVAKLAALEPDVLVVDTSFRESRAEIRTIAAKAPAAAVVAVAIPDSEESVIAFAEVGATGYVTRDASGEELVEAARHAAKGEVVCPPRFVATVFRRLALLAMQREPEPPVERLTTREREVVFLIGEGLSNKQIAERLLIEVATVKQHVHNILEKLDVAHRSEAAAAVQTAALT